MIKFYVRLLIAGICALLSGGFASAGKPSGSGTGFAITEDGWLVTNAHVVRGCQHVEVTGLGPARDIRLDNTNDIALIKTDVTKEIVPLLLRRSAVRLGEDIITLGFPLSGLLSDSIKMTTGSISALSGIQNDIRYLQISTPIQPGNSGGPIVDRSGYVVGVTTATLSKKWADQAGIAAQNVNFAIRALVIELFMQAQNVQANYAPDKPSAYQLSRADISETAAPSVYQVLCYQTRNDDIASTESRAQSPIGSEDQTPASPAPDSMISRDNYDAIGFDYQTIRQIDLEECKEQCQQDTGCAAITYHKGYRSCMLKDDVVALIKNKDAVASYKASKASEVVISKFTAISGFDSPGGDYARHRKTGYFNCFITCIGDDKCKAFSYIPKKKECWLKNRIGKLKPKIGVELGVR